MKTVLWRIVKSLVAGLMVAFAILTENPADSLDEVAVRSGFWVVITAAAYYLIDWAISGMSRKVRWTVITVATAVVGAIGACWFYELPIWPIESIRWDAWPDYAATGVFGMLVGAGAGLAILMILVQWDPRLAIFLVVAVATALYQTGPLIRYTAQYYPQLYQFWIYMLIQTVIALVVFFVCDRTLRLLSTLIVLKHREKTMRTQQQNIRKPSPSPLWKAARRLLVYAATLVAALVNIGLVEVIAFQLLINDTSGAGVLAVLELVVLVLSIILFNTLFTRHEPKATVAGLIGAFGFASALLFLLTKQMVDRSGASLEEVFSILIGAGLLFFTGWVITGRIEGAWLKWNPVLKLALVAGGTFAGYHFIPGWIGGFYIQMGALFTITILIGLMLEAIDSFIAWRRARREPLSRHQVHR